MIHELGKTNSIFNQFLSEVRDEKIQQDRMRFRRNMERMGEIFAYEISKIMPFREKEVITPLGTAHMQVLAQQPLLATILRAGIPLHQGLLNFFDQADNAFISAYRKYDADEDFVIKLEYVSSPSPKNRILVISDPMLATGGSLVAALKGLIEKGKPAEIHVVSVLASLEGIEFLKKSFSKYKMTIWTGAVDDELTAKAYIVPGLGDAGDLAYGNKEDEK
ncbi:uracil phosphoribosyltransferase [Candidatus Sulfidibacterium hydrothermale]|uniref:uracil phosphoribosyltransferase n=1 Tax=Candidatus Sulfidibacterium hydrothermale TaxID=2875962 RepID=UPI001F0B41B1|nr:uracil phosphoribosyltransferase [Candidatus Sulfidibacterium hydrothermale]UBM61219.1 uracil phosphoribosyltransferase [Candidatus Sulfidibacterium hydrothermale]